MPASRICPAMAHRVPAGAARGALAIMPGGLLNGEIAVRLTSGAASAGITEFFVEYQTDSGFVSLDAVGGRSLRELPAVQTVFSRRTLITVATPTHLDNWRQTWFGTYDRTGTAAADADPDSDGLVNIMEYIMGRNPTAVDTGIGVSPQVLALSLAQPGSILMADLRTVTTYDERVRLVMERSTDLQTWTAMSTRTGLQAWSGVVPTATLLSGGGRTRWTFNTGVTPATQPTFHLRLRVEELP